MALVLTWNLHHAANWANPVGQQTPMQRLALIAQLALANNVDVVCLQEVRQADLNVGGAPPGAAGQIVFPAMLPAPGPISNVTFTLYGVAFGGALFRNNYTVVYVYSEVNPTVAPGGPAAVAMTADGYLIMYRNATFAPLAVPVPAFLAPAAFNTGIYRGRPPVFIDLPVAAPVGGINTYRFFNWHNDAAGVNAHSGLANFNANVGAPPVNTRYVLLADVNRNQLTAFGAPVLGPWNALHVGPVPLGLDWVASTGPVAVALAPLLNFTSAGNHFPVAATV